MKSFTILAFGLVVLVALSMAYPQEAEEDDNVADELALQEGEGMFILMLFSTFNVTLEEFPQKGGHAMHSYFFHLSRDNIFLYTNCFSFFTSSSTGDQNSKYGQIKSKVF